MFLCGCCFCTFLLLCPFLFFCLRFFCDVKEFFFFSADAMESMSLMCIFYLGL